MRSPVGEKGRIGFIDLSQDIVFVLVMRFQNVGIMYMDRPILCGGIFEEPDREQMYH
tara:strand:- start:107 stop:277 length:171 start_codon:yes stop_codon:yes gene_type:complete